MNRLFVPAVEQIRYGKRFTLPLEKCVWTTNPNLCLATLSGRSCRSSPVFKRISTFLDVG